LAWTTEAKPDLPAHPDWITQATVTGRAPRNVANERLNAEPGRTGGNSGEVFALDIPFYRTNRAAPGRETESVPLEQPVRANSL
jgi:hypothetical protein